MIQIVATPGSGDGRARATAEALAEAIRARGHPVGIEVFHDLHRLARWSRSCARSFSLLICVGGDATMSAAAAAAIRHRVPFLPVPSGFGNLFAHAFGHTDDIPAAIDCLEAGDVAWVDAGMSHGEIFLSHESFGVLDEIQNAVEARPDQPRARWLRLLAYWRAGLRLLAGGAASSFQVEVDGTLVAKRAVLVTVANVRAYGDVLALTPDASPVDGLLDVFVIPRTSRLGLCRRLIALLLRLPRRGDDVLLFRGRRVAVSRPGQFREDIQVVPAALPVMVRRGWLNGMRATQREAEPALAGRS